MTEPYTCKFCGAPTWVHPQDQEAPADYCGEHGPDEAGADEPEVTELDMDAWNQATRPAPL